MVTWWLLDGIIVIEGTWDDTIDKWISEGGKTIIIGIVETLEGSNTLLISQIDGTTLS